MEQLPEAQEETAQEEVKPVKRHLKQLEFLADQSRFKFALAGRRGGKTSAFIEDFLFHSTFAPPEAELFYIGPTNPHAKELVWEPFCKRLDELGWAYNPVISKQVIRLSRGRKIYVIGAEKIHRIRGHKVYRAALDEVAFYKIPLKIIWEAVRPSLSDYRGGAIVGTTPKGRGTDVYDFYLDAKSKDGWKTFEWRTIDNPGISEDEIADARRELDERSFRQEYEATWESFEGLAYYNFSETDHVKQCKDFDQARPYFATLDFNVNPTSLLVGQAGIDPTKGYETAIFRREYSLMNSSTVATAQAFCRDFAPMKTQQLYIHGDSTGDSRRSNTGKSDYYYFEEVLKQNGFKYEKKVLPSNPPIVDRLAHVNGWLRNVYGNIRIMVDPSCKALIRDWSSQGLNGREPDTKNNLGHKADAAGYYIWHRHLATTRRPSQSFQL